MQSGAGGNWPRYDERSDEAVVRQTTGVSCLSAVGEMLLRHRGISVSQEIIRDIIGEPVYLGSLASTLNGFDPSWDGLIWRAFATTDASLVRLLRSGQRFGVVLINDFTDRMGHAVVLGGREREAFVEVSDPFDQTSYKMTLDDLQNCWGGEVILRWFPEEK